MSIPFLDSSASMYVSGKIVAVTGSFSRPADTTAYAANDTVSNSTSATTPITLTGAAKKAGGDGYITGIRLWTSQSTCTARFKVHIFTANTPTIAVTADNAAYALGWANRAYKTTSITLSAMATEGSGSDAARASDETIRIPFVCAPGSASLYVVLETLDAFTPASGQQFWLELRIDQN